MRSVRFTSSSGPNWPWVRQFPHAEPLWENSTYTLDTVPQTEPKTDWLVVYDGFFPGHFDTRVPLHRRIFVAGEPESFYQYQSDFLRQFGTVITPQADTNHPNVIVNQPAVNWFVGVQFQGHGNPGIPKLNFDDFLTAAPPKTKLCAVICSDKTETAGHRRRKEFVDKLMLELGDKVDFFGRGRNPIDDKDTALAHYSFHIALENSEHLHYWTEKLADSYLRGCMPIYSGCPNIGDYFPEHSFVAIDLNDMAGAIKTISGTLERGISTENKVALLEAKRRVLYEYNIFAMLERTFTQVQGFAQAEPGQLDSERLMPDAYFKKLNRLGPRLGRSIRRLLWKA